MCGFLRTVSVPAPSATNPVPPPTKPRTVAALSSRAFIDSR